MMNSLRRTSSTTTTSPALSDGCRGMMLSDSSTVCQYSVEKVKSSRRRRLEVRRLKYPSAGITGAVAGEIISGDDHCAEKIRYQTTEVGSDPSKSKEYSSEDRASELSLRSYSSLSSSDPSPGKGGISSRISGVKDDELEAKEKSRTVTCSPYGSISVIGRRREMEDAVAIQLGFLTRDSTEYGFFGVYDGHGGSRVAQACRDRLHRLLVKEIEEVEEEAAAAVVTTLVDWEKVMVGCFTKMDEEVNGNGREAAETATAQSETIGSTAVVAVVGEDVVVVANCGDSRAVLSRGGVAVSMSNDHKTQYLCTNLRSLIWDYHLPRVGNDELSRHKYPDRPDELERIEDAGGRVINWNGNRVLGVLATSRSIDHAGDHYLKPFVIPKPEVRVMERTSADEFLILASDGLWDVVSNEVACQVVRRCLGGRMRRRFESTAANRSGCDEVVNETRATEAAAVLVELAMARGSGDNISVVVVGLNKNEKCSSGFE
ncbi:protein-serine,threonine phosphatase [Sarracenia purpurea var. burkii]